VALTQLADELLTNELDFGRQPPTILAALGRLLTNNGADPAALFARAVVEHPRDFWLHMHAAANTKDTGARMGLAVAALAVRPQSAAAYRSVTITLLERGDWRTALVAANRGIKINPNSATSHLYLGLALLKKQDLTGAIAALQKALELEPGSAWPYWSLGDALRLKGDGIAAADAYRKAADLHSTALRARKNQLAAVAAFQNAVERDPADFRSRYLLGQIFQQQGRYSEAEEGYLGAFKVQPAFVPAGDALARLLATCPDDKVRDGTRAVEYATMACKRSGWKDPSCVDTLAAAYAEAGQFEEAVRYQTRALEDQALKDELRTAARERLELYLQKKPFRDPEP
jgi:tetratricopeptide (TPR) repeat protein